MMPTKSFWTVLQGGLSAILILFPLTSHADEAAGNLFSDSKSIILNPFLSAEIWAGSLTGRAGEYVYSVPGDGSKLSQLNWQIGDTPVVGGRLMLQAWDGMTLRFGGWTAASSRSGMDDFDWLYGFDGFNSWSDWSHSGDTRLAKALQADLSTSLRLYQSEQFQLNLLAGYRATTFKMNSYGGDYIYSSLFFRDTASSFDPNHLTIAYQQWWNTPYLGLGTSTAIGPIGIDAEVIGSPFVIARDKDYHDLRQILFKQPYARHRMAGATLEAHYALTSSISLFAHLEYQRFFQAKGSSEIIDGSGAADGSGVQVERTPKGSAGSDANTLVLALGVRAAL